LNFEQGQFWTKNWTSEFAREMAKPKVMKSLNEARPAGAKRSFKSRVKTVQRVWWEWIFKGEGALYRFLQNARVEA
jgi:hypothetical protein